MTEKPKKPSSTREALLSRIETFLAENNLQDETFGWLAIKDTKLVERLRNGGDITTRKLDDIIRYLAKPHSLKDIYAKEKQA